MIFISPLLPLQGTNPRSVTVPLGIFKPHWQGDNLREHARSPLEHLHHRLWVEFHFDDSPGWSLFCGWSLEEHGLPPPPQFYPGLDPLDPLLNADWHYLCKRRAPENDSSILFNDSPLIGINLLQYGYTEKGKRESKDAIVPSLSSRRKTF